MCLACRAGQCFSPEGTSENSPAFQRLDSNPKASQVPKGRKNRAALMCFRRPWRDSRAGALGPSVETLGFFLSPCRAGPRESLLYPASGLLMCSQTHSVQTFSAVPYLRLSLLEKWPRKLNQRKPTARLRKLKAVANRVLSQGRALPERQQFIAFEWQSLFVDKVQMIATLSLSLTQTTRKPVIYE